MKLEIILEVKRQPLLMLLCSWLEIWQLALKKKCNPSLPVNTKHTFKTEQMLEFFCCYCCFCYCCYCSDVTHVSSPRQSVGVVTHQSHEAGKKKVPLLVHVGTTRGVVGVVPLDQHFHGCVLGQNEADGLKASPHCRCQRKKNQNKLHRSQQPRFPHGDE